MKILTVVNDLNQGGTQRAAQTFSLEYARRGHQVTVLAHNGGGVRQSVIEEQGIPVHAVSDQLTVQRAIADCLAERPDVVHFHREGRYYPREAWLLDQLGGDNRPVVESSHFGYADFSPEAKKIGAHMHLSRWCLWRWQRWLGGVPACGVIVPNPVDTNRFVRPPESEVQAYRRHVLGVPDDAFVCGRVTQMGSANWHPAMFVAFRDLAEKEPNAYLVTIGLPESCDRQIAALPQAIRKRVVRRPTVDDDRELSCFYAALDVFVHAPVRGETFGLVLAEAMLCGTPVITVNTPHAGNSQGDVVGHLEGGYVALSSRWLSDTLRIAFDNPEQLARMSSRGRESIIDRFCAEKVSDQSLRTMTHLLEAPDGKSAEQRMQADDQLQTTVDPEDLRELLHTGVGRASPVELAMMRLKCNPWIYRAHELKRTARMKSKG